ncbi:hypothetical protein HBA55_26185 [Pseudomaricurvus alkylphenolicus]|uniref:sulfotransferase family 2 domain-containing protein n=1 Tax=Pseudomaricurvus alkylphenolicus TaxID=1306991 RepID=UPI0014246782|nr:sulfotransferase family 2 domain-containing protein [Pseudomaricurvus alkylphenolicus]NIB43124.1 hypothetical protein [Pseudomaricurvus alkylphenolicus]
MNKKIIWIKKAKCAGTSLESVLKERGAIYYVHPRTSLAELEDPNNRVICVREALFPYGKTPIKQENNVYELNSASTLLYRLRSRAGVPFRPLDFIASKYPDFFYECDRFAIVRNPYDKFISSWKYLKSLQHLSIGEVLKKLPQPSSLHDWVHITQLQTEAISHKDNLVVNRLLYMEMDMDDELRDILSAIGLSDVALPQENRSRRGKLAEYLSPEVSDQIYTRFKPDFDTFGYDKDYRVVSPKDSVCVTAEQRV